MLEVVKVRISTEVKEQATEILQEHGITISQFLRSCTHRLVKDSNSMLIFPSYTEKRK